MNKRIKLISVLLTFVLLFSITGNYAAYAEDSKTVTQLIELTGNQNVDVINSVPENIVPIYFDEVQKASEYINIIDKYDVSLSSEDALKYYDENNNRIDLSGVEISDLNFVSNNYDIVSLEDNDNGIMPLASNTGIKSKVVYSNGISKLHVDATYAYASGKFTSVKSVTSYYTGLTIGNEWKQKSYASSITNSGKTLNVTVNDVFDHYVYINTTITRLSSEKKTYKVSWNY